MLPTRDKFAGLALTALSLTLPAQSQVAPSGPPPNGPSETSDLRSGANSFTEAQVKDRLERFGYSDVSALQKDDDGIWRGRATYGGKPFVIGVDYRGAVLRTEP
jgi:hypothetical protein